MSILNEIVMRGVLLVSNKWLADEYRLKLRNNLRMVKKMDYKRHDVYLCVDTKYENDWRVNSCALEPETIEWIERYVKPNDILFDVGANVGAYSLVAAKYTGGQAKIYAIEPAFTTFAQLTRNMLLNECSDCIVPLQIALFEETKIDYFYYSDIAAGYSLHSFGSNVDFKGNEFKPASKQAVIGYKMDDFVRMFGTGVPTHVKLDVDGKELEILRGSEQTLADQRLKTLLIEINENLSTTSELLGLIEEAGLRLHSKHRQMDGADSGPFSGMVNCIFVREGEV